MNYAKMIVACDLNDAIRIWILLTPLLKVGKRRSFKQPLLDSTFKQEV